MITREHAVGTVTVQLSEEEDALACEVADFRRAWALEQGARNKFENDYDLLEVDRTGARAELAVSRAYSVEWTAPFRRGDLHEPDVSGVDVRGTTWVNGGLIIRERDRDDRAYVLVTVAGLVCRIPGWLFGWEAKLEDYRQPAGYWRVPQGALHDPAWLPIIRVTP